MIGTLQVSPDYDETRKAQLEKELEKLRARYGFSLERPDDPQAAVFNREWRQMSDHIRKHVRQFIKDLKARKMHNAGVKLSEAQKKKAWPYADDEIEIAQDADWDRMRAVLDLTGNADQFDRITSEASRLYGMSGDIVSSHPLDQEEAMAEFRKMIAERNVRMNQKHDPEKYADWK